MAKWEKVVKLIQKHLDAPETDGIYSATVKVKDGKDRIVIFYKNSFPKDVDWLQITIPIIADLSPELINIILEKLESFSGGLVKIGPTYSLRYTMPIENIVFWDEIRQPMEMICQIANAFEQALDDINGLS